jgi:hypothetical protein
MNKRELIDDSRFMNDLTERVSTNSGDGSKRVNSSATLSLMGLLSEALPNLISIWATIPVPAVPDGDIVMASELPHRNTSRPLALFLFEPGKNLTGWQHHSRFGHALVFYRRPPAGIRLHNHTD